ncbi:hypothetical protein QTH68_09770, partial [Streptococcus sp. VTCC 12814]|nr:hypothetical protein [Streptococcus sp. VTCC 12814]
GLFFYNKIGSIIPMVVLPTTEIIEPFYNQMNIRVSFRKSPKRLNKNNNFVYNDVCNFSNLINFPHHL